MGGRVHIRYPSPPCQHLPQPSLQALQLGQWPVLTGVQLQVVLLVLLLRWQQRRLLKGVCRGPAADVLRRSGAGSHVWVCVRVVSSSSRTNTTSSRR